MGGNFKEISLVVGQECFPTLGSVFYLPIGLALGSCTVAPVSGSPLTGFSIEGRLYGSHRSWYTYSESQSFFV